MTIADPKFRRLTLDNVNRSPRRRGVYALYEKRTLLYVGLAEGGEDTIRSRLRTHLRDRTGSELSYKREASTTPAERHEKLLAEHVAAHGDLPAQNAPKK
jgi:hypothetical protein